MFLVAAVSLATISFSPRGWAVVGVGDSTILIGDLTDTWKWPRELEQWHLLITNTTDQIRKADELIRIVGDPKAVVQKLIDSVPDLLEPVENAIGLDTRVEALRTARELYSLGSVAVQTYSDAKKVGPSYDAFGESVKRDPSRFQQFVLQEAMAARYKKAVENAERVDRKELEVQKRALADMKNAQTSTEVAIINSVILASKQRQDLAHQRADQAKAELDAFRGQLGVEDARKVAADREWAQGVIERLRQKALASYRTQMGLTGESVNE